MKTFKQIKDLVENISNDISIQLIRSDSDISAVSDSVTVQYNDIINTVKEFFSPLLQFNIDASSSENAKAVFSKIAENVNKNSSVQFLPDGQHTSDKVGNLVIETPTIMEWQGSKEGQNFVINYTNKTASKGQALLNQLIVNMLLSLPSKSFKLHFVDLAFSAQSSFLIRNLDTNLFDKLISTPNEWGQLQDELRDKMVKAMGEYGDVVSYNMSKHKVEVPYDVVVINDYQKIINDMRYMEVLFENGSKGGIYFVLMNNLDSVNERNDDALMALTDFYQVLEAENYGDYDKKAYIRCTPILDNPILAKACFEYINSGAALQQVAAVTVDHEVLLSSGFEKIDMSMVNIPVGPLF